MADAGWVLQSPSHVEAPDRIEAPDPRGELTTLIEQLHRDGELDLYAHVDTDARIIEIRQADIDATGPLAGYIGESLSDTQKRLPLIDQAAESRGGEPAIRYGRVEDGALPVHTEIRDADRTVLAAMLSSYGGRNTGENVLSGVFRTGYGGWILGGGYSRGVAAISPSDSRNGRYDALQLSAQRPTPAGIFSARAAYSESKQGGDLEDFDLNSDTAQYSVGWSYPVQGVEPYVSLTHYRQKTDIGIVSLEGAQNSTALMAGAEMDHSIEWEGADPMMLTLDASLEQGLTSRTTGFGLGREVDSQWTRLALDLTANQPMGDWLWSFNAGAQENSGTLPNQRDFVVGGQHRGNGYRAGIASVTRGQYAGVRLFTPAIDTENNRFRPFVGYNAGNGRPLIGERRAVESAELGTVVRFGEHFSGEIGYAWVINEKNINTTDSDGRVNFNLVARF
ncbi:ShlB/FhaC/HecB family hemolysin secretion/activation protein [Thioalkalivibrio sp. ALE16]|uniref:ShlB/FhaC/HecB family hemolysin secretion/activation protein n=1 Tax=Thioalkalivibrio sp. ALE16 TaxID=1158172 RepID=UPI00037F48DE|nr:ShlB/FhaC/HecB family hemolysin secretion/activation protein [Thioalkalivibrio sp. ALE16]